MSEEARASSTGTQPVFEPCTSCGGKNFADARYCSSCGIRLGAALEEAAAPSIATRTTLGMGSGGTVPESESDSEEMPIADPLIGTIVAGRYRIIEPLGRGGMGVVYRVEHARIGKLMALKLLTGELSRDTEVVARFKREALMVSKLSHPNTVQVFDFGVSEGLTYLAMEYPARRRSGSHRAQERSADPRTLLTSDHPGLQLPRRSARSGNRSSRSQAGKHLPAQWAARPTW